MVHLSCVFRSRADIAACRGGLLGGQTALVDVHFFFCRHLQVADMHGGLVIAERRPDSDAGERLIIFFDIVERSDKACQFLLADIGEQTDKFIAADAVDMCPAANVAECLRHGDDEAVARIVPLVVVTALQSVDVEVQDADRARGGGRVFEFLDIPCVGGAVAAPGQAVVIGAVAIVKIERTRAIPAKTARLYRGVSATVYLAK